MNAALTLLKLAGWDHLKSSSGAREFILACSSP
jgi:hypothetical protein